MTRAPFPLRLRRADFPDGTEDMYAYYGYPVPEIIIDAVPSAAFDVDGWVSPSAEPTMLLEDGDTDFDLGDRIFAVVHTPDTPTGPSACSRRGVARCSAATRSTWTPS